MREKTWKNLYFSIHSKEIRFSNFVCSFLFRFKFPSAFRMPFYLFPNDFRRIFAFPSFWNSRPDFFFVFRRFTCLICGKIFIYLLNGSSDFELADCEWTRKKIFFASWWSKRETVRWMNWFFWVWCMEIKFFPASNTLRPLLSLKKFGF